MSYEFNSHYASQIEDTGADRVEWCSGCGAPVVVWPGKMDEHRQRCHVAPAAAKPGVNVRRWERG